MNFSQFRLFVILCGLLLMSACATAPRQSVSTSTPGDSLADVIGVAELAAPVTLPAGNALGESSVMVRDSYTAASGKTCRRLSNANGQAIARVLCKAPTGGWQFARDLQPRLSSATPLTMPAVAVVRDQHDSGNTSLDNASSIVDTPVMLEGNTDDVVTIDLNDTQSLNSADYGQLVERTLAANETLWGFAKRTTGNALNWQVIADVNQINDARTLATGDVLSIPANLVNDGQ